MSWMSKYADETNAGGGLGKMFSRAISGESISECIHSTGGPGMIAFASAFLATS